MTSNADRRAAFLQEIGVGPQWRLRHPAAVPESGEERAEAIASPTALPEARPAAAEVRIAAAPAGDVATMDWRSLADSVAACRKCGLCEGRTNAVFGVGETKVKWLFVGEGPGDDEDRQGEPFVGQAGRLLDNMLLAMGLRRGENTFITTIVKCRATDGAGGDRSPAAEEIAACMPYLERQIALIEPEVLIALGKTAALSLLALDPATTLAQLRGKVHRYAGRPLVVTCDPADLLHNMPDKSKAWEDLCLAMAIDADVR